MKSVSDQNTNPNQENSWKVEEGTALSPEGLSFDQVDILAQNEAGENVLLHFPNPNVQNLDQLSHLNLQQIEVTASDADGNTMHLSHSLDNSDSNLAGSATAVSLSDAPKGENVVGDSWNDLSEWKVEEGESVSGDAHNLNFEEIKVTATADDGTNIMMNMPVTADSDMHDLATIDKLNFEEIKVTIHNDNGDSATLTAPMQADGYTNINAKIEDLDIIDAESNDNAAVDAGDLATEAASADAAASQEIIDVGDLPDGVAPDSPTGEGIIDVGDLPTGIESADAAASQEIIDVGDLPDGVAPDSPTGGGIIDVGDLPTGIESADAAASQEIIDVGDLPDGVAPDSPAGEGIIDIGDLPDGVTESLDKSSTKIVDDEFDTLAGQAVTIGTKDLYLKSGDLSDSASNAESLINVDSLVNNAGYIKIGDITADQAGEALPEGSYVSLGEGTADGVLVQASALQGEDSTATLTNLPEGASVSNEILIDTQAYAKYEGAVQTEGDGYKPASLSTEMEVIELSSSAVKPLTEILGENSSYIPVDASKANLNDEGAILEIQNGDATSTFAQIKIEDGSQGVEQDWGWYGKTGDGADIIPNLDGILSMISSIQELSSKNVDSVDVTGAVVVDGPLTISLGDIFSDNVDGFAASSLGSGIMMDGSYSVVDGDGSLEFTDSAAFVGKSDIQNANADGLVMDGSTTVTSDIAAQEQGVDNVISAATEFVNPAGAGAAGSEHVQVNNMEAFDDDEEDEEEPTNNNPTGNNPDEEKDPETKDPEPETKMEDFGDEIANKEGLWTSNNNDDEGNEIAAQAENVIGSATEFVNPGQGEADNVISSATEFVNPDANKMEDFGDEFSSNSFGFDGIVNMIDTAYASSEYDTELANGVQGNLVQNGADNAADHLGSADSSFETDLDSAGMQPQDMANLDYDVMV